MYAAGGVTDELVQAYLESGFGLMGIPEEQGGVPCDRVTLGLLTEEFAHYCGCLTPFLNNTLAMRDLIDFGSPEQVEMAMNAYMETGKPIFSLGFSEPGAGSDNASMTSVTKKQADGTYILNGQKTWVTQGEVFPYVLVIAKDEDPDPKNREMTMWLVPRELEGVSTAPLHKLGQQIIPFCEMYFDDVVLTEDMRVGETGKGFYNLMKNYEMERCLIIAQTLGCAQAAMDDAAAYVNERITMGKPLAARQLIQEKLTEMGDQPPEHPQHAVQDAVEDGQRPVRPHRLRAAEALRRPRVRRGGLRGAADLRRPRLHHRDPRRPHLAGPARQPDRRRHRRDHGLHRRPSAGQAVR